MEAEERIRRGYGEDTKRGLINSKSFSAFIIIIISIEGLFPEVVFMLYTNAKPNQRNLIKERILSDTQIPREDKMHIVGITDGFVESLKSHSSSIHGTPI